MARASGDRGELPLGFWVDVGALMKGAEELVLLICMGAEEALLALVQLDLSCFDGSSHAPLLCDHGGNFSVCVMIALELSCDSPVFLGPGIVVHCSVCGVVDEALKEPVREFSLFIDSDVLQGKEFVLVDGLINAGSAQAVQPIQLDIGGEDMHDMVAIRDWDEEIKDVSFVFFISFWHLPSPLPFHISPVSVFCPVLVGFFQMSRMCLMLCQIITPLFEYFELFLIVMANFLIFLHNSSQSLHDEEELLPAWCPVSFESSTH